MERKLVRQGQNALTVTVPASWAKENQLKAGDVIDLKQHSNSLVINSNKKQSSKQVNLPEISNKGLRSVISSLYKSGYQSFVIKSNQKFTLSELANLTSSFYGLDLSYAGQQELTFSCNLSESKDLNQLIIKMFQCVSYLCDEISENSNFNLDEIKKFQKIEIIKLRDRALRVLQLQYHEINHSFDFYDLITTLEKIAADIIYYASYLDSRGEKQSSLFIEIKLLLQKSMSCFMKKDFKEMNDLWINNNLKNNALFQHDGLDTLTKENKGEVVYYYSLRHKIHHINSRILGIISKN